MTAPGVGWGGKTFLAVMRLSDVQYINAEFHDNVTQDVHLVAEATLVKDIVSVQLGGPEPICINDIAREGGVFGMLKGGGVWNTPNFLK